MVISNCVLNLAMDKEAVLSEVFRVLKSGGELYFSDVYTDKRVPKELQKDKVRTPLTAQKTYFHHLFTLVSPHLQGFPFTFFFLLIFLSN